jgi:hypothetical protein
MFTNQHYAKIIVLQVKRLFERVLNPSMQRCARERKGVSPRDELESQRSLRG